jgi:cell division protein FtsW (lipid II flippase)
MRHLPDSHTDFVFTVGVDGVGTIILCFAALALLAFVVIRKRWRSNSN